MQEKIKKSLGKYRIFVRVLLLITSGIYQLIVYFSIVDRQVDNLSLLFWFISIFLLFFAYPLKEPYKKDKDKKIPDRRATILVIILIALGVLLRLSLMFNTKSFHIDEYLTAHFSYSLGDITKLDWFAVYPPKGVWIVQFPVLYFVLQKIFFNLFGISTLVMRFSVIPYIIIIFSFTYLVAKELFSHKIAVLSVIILTFLAPELYLSRWALHFISSTAFFLIATYFFILSYKLKKRLHFGLFGFFLGLCYSTYYASYLAVPIILVFFISLVIYKKIGKQHLSGFFLSTLIFGYTVSPLIIYASKVDNFFTQRTRQVKLINGQWSPYREVEAGSTESKKILIEQTQTAIKSLYTNGIGGNGGYWFGNLSLFDKSTFILLLLSIGYSFYQILIKRHPESLVLVTTLLATFVAGVILTTPPPAFHRASIAFPFTAVLLGTLVGNIHTYLSKKTPNWAFWVAGTFIMVITLSNIFHFKRVLIKDGPDDPDFPKIENELVTNKQNYVYISAFNSYSLGKVLYIRSRGKIKSLTLPLDEIIYKVPANKTSYMVVLYPEDKMLEKIMSFFDQVTIVDKYNTHLLLKVDR